MLSRAKIQTLRTLLLRYTWSRVARLGADNLCNIADSSMLRVAGGVKKKVAKKQANTAAGLRVLHVILHCVLQAWHIVQDVQGCRVVLRVLFQTHRRHFVAAELSLSARTHARCRRHTQHHVN